MNNELPSISIMDGQFAHGTSLGSGDLRIYPKYFKWNRFNSHVDQDICVITESFFNQINIVQAKYKIAMIIEPISIDPKPYQWIRENHGRFEFILSHNIELKRDLGAKVVWYPFGGCWIKPEDRKIWPKTKLMSIIVSDKKQTEGHKLRHDVVTQFGNRQLLDVYGRGYRPVENKIEALKDYMFSIVIENERNDGWFTEKIIDCFMTGTVPIYWGCRRIDDFFSCIPQFGTLYGSDTLEKPSLEWMIQNASKSIYDWVKDGPVKKNFELAQAYTCPEDWLWQNFFIKHFNL